MAEEYTPISCSFYDRLEEAATLNKTVELELKEKDQIIKVKSIIKHLLIRDKVEYMRLANGTEIRLDRIHTLNGIELQNHC